MTDFPLVSVILPVYNAEKYLADSIRSILSQRFENFEFIILNDGSTDQSSEIVKSFSDSRIRYFEHANKGLANTLNKGIELSRGKYIARQDNDDISHPERLGLQVEFLEKNTEYALVGSSASIMDENGSDTGRKHLHPCQSSHLKLELVFDNPFVHSSVMFRKEAIVKVGLYDPDTRFFEDHNLWSRVSYQYKVANLPDFLLQYREVGTGMSKTTSNYIRRVQNQCKLNLDHYLPSHSIQNEATSKQFHQGNYDSKSKISIGMQIEELIKIIFEKENSEEKEKAFQRMILKMEMSRIRNLISNVGDSFFKLCIYKLRRKFVFNSYNKLVKSHHF